MKVRVDPERCQGHTLCNMAVPEVFQLRENDGHAWVLFDRVPPHLEHKVRDAAQTCPENAIVVEEE